MRTKVSTIAVRVISNGVIRSVQNDKGERPVPAAHSRSANQRSYSPSRSKPKRGHRFAPPSGSAKRHPNSKLNRPTIHCAQTSPGRRSLRAHSIRRQPYTARNFPPPSYRKRKVSRASHGDKLGETSAHRFGRRTFVSGEGPLASELKTVARFPSPLHKRVRPRDHASSCHRSGHGEETR